MLRQLLHNERLRYAWVIAGCLAVSVFVLLVIILPLLATLRRTPTVGALLCIGMLLFGIAGIWLVFAYRFYFTSSTRRLAERLARYGELDKVMNEIDAELHSDSQRFLLGQPTFQFGSPQPDCLVLTENWLVRLCPGASVIVHLPDLVWIHKRIVMRSDLLSHGRMDYELGCRTRNGDDWHFDTWTEGKTDQVLRELLERRPELLTGYRGEWLDLFQQAEASVTAELESRRKKIAAMTPEEREQWLDASWDDCQHFMYRVDRQAAAAGRT
jgi:hypothetical protein